MWNFLSYLTNNGLLLGDTLNNDQTCPIAKSTNLFFLLANSLRVGGCTELEINYLETVNLLHKIKMNTPY